MIRRAIAFSLLFQSVLISAGEPDEKAVSERVDTLMKRLSIDDKIKLMHTKGFLETIPVLDFKPSTLNDGPLGVRNANGTAFPSQISMGSTWNRNLIFQSAATIGKEAKTYKNTLVQLGPMINLIRHPNGGRNFEMFSEDPFLTGSLSVSYVNGMQSEKVSACPKHIVGNEQETDRKGMDVQIDERTLREVYLLPFEMTVKEADPWFMMTAYNKVNGTYCYMNRRLLTDIARGDWKYQGAFCSDWTSAKDAVGAVEAGLDFDLHNSMAYNKDLPELVKNGTIPEAKIDPLVRRILRVYVKSGILDGDRSGEINKPGHYQTARQVAEEGIVLLKNEKMLPLDTSTIKRIAVFGPNAEMAHSAGGGSGGVRSPYEVTPVQGLRNLCGNKVEVKVHSFYGSEIPIPAAAFQHPLDGRPQPGLQGLYFNDTMGSGAPALTRTDAQLSFDWFDNSPAQGKVDNAAFSAKWQGDLIPPVSGFYTLSVSAKGGYTVSVNGKKIIDSRSGNSAGRKTAQVELTGGKPVKIEATFQKEKSDASFSLNWKVPVSETEVSEAASDADVAIVVVGTNKEEEGEGKDWSSWVMRGAQADLIRNVAKANPRTVVVLVNGSPVEMASWIESVPAVLEMWYDGMEGGNALADILFGRVNPSGKLPVTIPKKIEDIGSHGHFGTSKFVKIPEGLNIGYRHFDKHQIEPLFPFGYGLSYTTFTYGGLLVKKEGDAVAITFRVTNTGKRAGAEIAQVYVGAQGSSIERPLRELKGFEKVTLQPGETKSVSVRLPERAFAFFDTKAGTWRVGKGAYTIEVGGSSRNLPLKESVALEETLLR